MPGASLPKGKAQSVGRRFHAAPPRTAWTLQARTRARARWMPRRRSAAMPGGGRGACWGWVPETPGLCFSVSRRLHIHRASPVFFGGGGAVCVPEPGPDRRICGAAAQPPPATFALGPAPPDRRGRCCACLGGRVPGQGPVSGTPDITLGRISAPAQGQFRGAATSHHTLIGGGRPRIGGDKQGRALRVSPTLGLGPRRVTATISARARSLTRLVCSMPADQRTPCAARLDPNPPIGPSAGKDKRTACQVQARAAPIGERPGRSRISSA